MRPFRIPVILSVLLAALAGAEPARAVREPAGRWLRVDSERFTLFSNAGETRSRNMALQVERLRHVLESIAPALRGGTDRPLYIYVFRDTTEFRGYAKKQGVPNGVGGLSFTGADGDYVMVDASSDSDTFGVLYHEYLHHVLKDAFPRAPLWLNEGMAEYFSTFWTNGYQAEIGTPVQDHLDLLRSSRRLSLERVLDVTPTSPEYRDVDLKRRFHAEAWLLTHYLLGGDAATRAALAEYLVRIHEGASGPEVFTGAFGNELSDVERELSAYVRRPTLPGSRMEISTRVSEASVGVEAMDTEDVHARLGQLLAHGVPTGLGMAERHLVKALKLDPRHRASLSAMGVVRSRQGRDDDAFAYRRMSAAAYHFNNGNTEEGIAGLREALTSAGDPMLRRQLRLQLESLDARRD